MVASTRSPDRLNYMESQAMIYAIMCQMLPKHGETVGKVVMHHTTFTSEQAAKDEKRALFLQNLPFHMWVVSFPDPRVES